MDNTNLLICVVICCMVSLNSFLVGYIIGSKNRSLINNNTKSSIFNKSNNKKSSIDNHDNAVNPHIGIDESKVVIAITTDNLERKYTQLGNIKQSDENISGSIDKLKHLKK